MIFAAGIRPNVALAKEAEARARKEHELNREKFEFDAAKLAQYQAIVSDLLYR